MEYNSRQLQLYRNLYDTMDSIYILTKTIKGYSIYFIKIYPLLPLCTDSKDTLANLTFYVNAGTDREGKGIGMESKLENYIFIKICCDCASVTRQTVPKLLPLPPLKKAHPTIGLTRIKCPMRQFF